MNHPTSSALRQGLFRTPCTAALLALTLACQACAGRRARDAESADDAEVSVRESVVPAAPIEANVEQFGNVVTIAATAKCDLRRIRAVQQVVWENGSGSRSSGGSWDAKVLIVAVMVTGGLIIAGATVIDKASKPNLVNPGAKMANGVILGTLGLGLGGAMVWLAAPGTGGGGTSSSRRVEIVDEDAGLVKANVPCGNVESIPARASVTGRLPGPEPVQIALGRLDSQGKLVIDLARKVPAAALEKAGTPRTMPVYIRGGHVGLVRFDP
jgi:hypothetical protein